MIKNIIFDIGNVLADYRWKAYFAEFGYEEEIQKRLASATTLSPVWCEYDRGVWTEEEILQGFIANDPELEPYIRETLTSLKGLLIPFDYAVEWVKELKKKGYGVYYLSNFSYPAERDCPEILEFCAYADGGILSYQEKVIKPDPEIYQLLMERYGLAAEECVFLDDTEKNVVAAKELGMQGIWFQNKTQAEKELHSLGVEL